MSSRVMMHDMLLIANSDVDEKDADNCRSVRMDSKLSSVVTVPGK